MSYSCPETIQWNQGALDTSFRREGEKKDAKSLEKKGCVSSTLLSAPLSFQTEGGINYRAVEGNFRGQINLDFRLEAFWRGDCDFCVDVFIDRERSHIFAIDFCLLLKLERSLDWDRLCALFFLAA